MRAKNFSYFRAALTAVWIVLVAGSLAVAATDAAIGIDHSRIRGNTTLFDGSRVVAAAGLSDLQLNSGAKIRLAMGSRATVFGRRLVLESGDAQLESKVPFEVEARSLHVSSTTPGTVARIQLNGDRQVRVATLQGGVQVSNAAGLLVARVSAGSALDFDPQPAGAAAPTRATGCLFSKSGKLVLVEQTTNVVLQVQGEGLEREIGNQVEVTGKAEKDKPAVSGASHLVTVISFKQLKKGACSDKVAVVVGGGSRDPSGSVGAGSTATSGVGPGTIAVLGGVAAAATVGGLAAVGSLPGQDGNAPAASR